MTKELIWKFLNLLLIKNKPQNNHMNGIYVKGLVLPPLKKITFATTWKGYARFVGWVTLGNVKGIVAG